ncbi:DUF1800 domain-containing protein [Paraburkholderia humisilvae]|uniref:DUF1800 domain-containing protein n=1 Tax=Paraburkholderia humisilvae TaxID=627669 RepID=A0A6J5E3L1_9BURK|nr:DUF1800 domain-containing protein [Paraburkholderia humisilvae]CAB3759856.1 hypothetical protein LMG29542_03690 [Paraburkholderia humisilvae]
MNDSAADHATAIALNRFGLGAVANEPAPADPKAWLLAQFDHYDVRPAAWSNEPDSATLVTGFAQRRRALRDMRKQGKDDAAASQTDAQASGAMTTANGAASGASNATAQTAAQDARKALRADIVATYRDAVNARVSSALNTPTPFVERLVHFWANHFAVSTEKPQVAVLAGAFEAEAIRPHVLGRFEDMLIAVERHPAMQLFLDQTNSVGPDSIAAMRAAQRNPARPRGLNENLAREIMELHTLGARSGYTQEDVTEFARALTGWSIALPQARDGGNHAGNNGVNSAVNNAGAPGHFVFRTALHEPGARTVIGRRYDQSGEAQPLAILHDFASSPATAHHVADKLARHFVSDTPPPAVVARLADAFTRSGGDLPTVYRALIDSPDAWSPVAAKFKSPWEWTISAMRGLGWQDLGNLQSAPLFTQLGQPVWRPGSPAGYDDVAASWASPDALLRRVELAQRLASRVGDQLDARALGEQLFAGSLSAPTASAVSRAESASTALALLFVSPDFQRR